MREEKNPYSQHYDNISGSVKIIGIPLEFKLRYNGFWNKGKIRFVLIAKPYPPNIMYLYTLYAYI